MTLQYDKQIEVLGIRIPLVTELVTPRIERQMRLGNYDIIKCEATSEFVTKGDRVLELGAGIGVISALVGTIHGVEEIVAVEADPRQLEALRETLKLNGNIAATLLLGAVAQGSAEEVALYLRQEFWSSSLDPEVSPFIDTISAKAFRLADLLLDHEPTVLVCGINGGEIGLFDDVNLDGVRDVIIELATSLYDQSVLDEVINSISRKGFEVDQNYLVGNVRVLHRSTNMGVSGLQHKVTTPEHKKSNPEVTIVTGMKNEGPFILEWIAYHRSIGINNFLIYTNDCSDGTDLLLDRLDELGVVTHLPNPASVTDSTYYQPVLLAHSENVPMMKRSDYTLCIDVDEFVVVRTGNGSISDLLEAAGPFHALSMAELNFSSDGKWDFEDGWVTENFQEHETEKPGHWQARRGVKTLIHNIANVKKLQAHRPFLFDGTEDEFIWLDGSGRELSKEFTYSNPQNGIDRRGAYDLVCLNHYPLRSVESYLLKQDRGDVVNVNKDNYTEHYYRVRSLGGNRHGWIDRNLPSARSEWQNLIEDKELATLHAQAVNWHKQRIKEIAETPKIKSLSDWIREHYFQD